MIHHYHVLENEYVVNNLLIKVLFFLSYKVSLKPPLQINSLFNLNLHIKLFI
jgi:hypothetical protein